MIPAGWLLLAPANPYLGSIDGLREAFEVRPCKRSAHHAPRGCGVQPTRQRNDHVGMPAEAAGAFGTHVKAAIAVSRRRQVKITDLGASPFTSTYGTATSCMRYLPAAILDWCWP